MIAHYYGYQPNTNSQQFTNCYIKQEKNNLIIRELLGDWAGLILPKVSVVGLVSNCDPCIRLFPISLLIRQLNYFHDLSTSMFWRFTHRSSHDYIHFNLGHFYCFSDLAVNKLTFLARIMSFKV